MEEEREEFKKSGKWPPSADEASDDDEAGPEPEDDNDFESIVDSESDQSEDEHVPVAQESVPSDQPKPHKNDKISPPKTGSGSDEICVPFASQ